MISHDEEMECFYSECQGCEHKRNAIYSAKELVESLVKQVYIERQFDDQSFEQILDDLCHVLNVKSIYGPLQIENKKQNQPRIHLVKCA